MCRHVTTILTCRWRIACCEWVTNQSWIASALRTVVLDPARCSHSTHPGTWVHTLVPDTGQVLGTVGVDGTFWFAFNIGVALEARVTCARGSLVSIGAFSIDTTWRWSTWVNDLWSWCSGGGSVTTGEWISNISLIANTKWDMVSNTAVSIDTTESRTWVLTFSVDTRFVLGTF